MRSTVARRPDTWPHRQGKAIWSTSVAPRCLRCRSTRTHSRRAGRPCRCWMTWLPMPRSAPASSTSPVPAPVGRSLWDEGTAALQARHYIYPSLSPDGTRVALVVVADDGSDLWVYDQRRAAMTRLTFGGGTYRFPRCGPSRRMASGWPTGKAGRPGDPGENSGRCRSTSGAASGRPGRPSGVSRAAHQAHARRSRPTGDGSRINRSSRAPMKCTSARSRRRRPGRVAVAGLERRWR